MTNELIALVAILSNDGLPEQHPDGVAAIQLNYSNVNPDAYRRAVDGLDRLALLTDDAVEKKTIAAGITYEVVRIGQLRISSPADNCYASDQLGRANEPIVALASLAPVEAPTPLRPITTKVRVLTPLPPLSDRDPGDEHDGPEAA